MILRRLRINLHPRRLAWVIQQKGAHTPEGRFFLDVLRLIWIYKWYSLAIFGVTILQEFSALWPVNLLGDLVDRVASGELGNIFWQFLAASLLYPALLRGNVVLRHKMFYESEMTTRVRMMLEVAEQGDCTDAESAGATHTRVLNAVAGVANTCYHILGDFTPVIIKIIIVFGRLLAYNRQLALVYMAGLTVPAALTLLFNKWLVVLRDSQYEAISNSSGAGIRCISERGSPTARAHFLDVMRKRTEILIELVAKGQLYLYLRQAALIGNEFLVLFLALRLRTQIGITPGDITKIVGYTTQVSAAFLSAAAVLDAILSYSRAYHVHAIREKRL